MSIIKKYAPFLNLTNYQTFITDEKPNSEYFNITEFKETFSGGKNGFLIAGSPHLKETTEIKIEILDVEGNPVYFEPGSGFPEYYEGTSTLIAVHIYNDTPIGIGKITILAEAKTFNDELDGIKDIPNEWSGVYNIKWERKFKINKLILNEDKVRFYKRPLIVIDEIVKPIFTVNIPTITQSGSVVGIPQIPTEASDLSNWTAGTSYLLKITDSSNWTSSIDNNTINIPSLDYTATVTEVLNNKELLVNQPYTDNNIVKSFSAASYTSSFEYIEGKILSESSLTGSFANIQMSQLKTFVGDVARVKIYRKSRNDVGDFQLTQDTKLESTELLRDLTITTDSEISYGNLTEFNLENYWSTSSADHPVSIDVVNLQNSMFIDYNPLSGSVQKIETVNTIPISNLVEYTLEFKARFIGTVDSTKKIKAYLSSSDFEQTIIEFESSDELTSRTVISSNIISALNDDVSLANAKLVFDVTGDDWYISDISLRNAQETSFSPDEFILIQNIPRNLESETFDFKFEFYDINNNYIPVDVLASKTFNGGNLTNDGANAVYMLFNTDGTIFRFDTGSLAVPLNQEINFTVTKNNITGTPTFASSAYDDSGILLTSESYAGGQYPGLLTEVTDSSAVLTVGNFTGSNSNTIVQNIVYTASIDQFNEFETIYRIANADDGQDGYTTYLTKETHTFPADSSGTVSPGVFANGSTESRFYKGTVQYTFDDTIPYGLNTYRTGSTNFTGITMDQIISSGQVKWTPNDITSDTGNFDVELIDNSTGIILTKFYTFSKSNAGADGDVGADGADGVDAKAVSLTTDRYVVTYDGDELLFPINQTSSLSANSTNFITPHYQFLKNNVEVQSYSPVSTLHLPSITALPDSGSTDLYRVNVKESTGSLEAFDSINIFGVKQGSDAYTVFLTNETHAFTSDANGLVTDYTSGITEVRFFRGAEQYNYAISGNNTYSIQSVSAIGIEMTADTNGTDRRFTPSNATADSGTVTIVIRDNNTTGTEFNKVYTFGKSIQGSSGSIGPEGPGGVAGLQVGNGMIHYQITSSTQPTTPDASSFTFSTQTFIGLTANWAIGAPVYESGNSNKYWYSVYKAIEDDPNGDIASGANLAFQSPTQAIGFSGLVTFTATDTVGDGTDNLSFGVSGSTLINGDNISTGRIISTNFISGSGDGFTTAGSEYHLDNGTIATRNFQITSAGNLFAQDGNFSGSVNAQDGNIGGWNIIPGEISQEGLILNSTRPAMEIYDSSGSLRVDISNNDELSSITGSIIAIVGSVTIQAESSASVFVPGGNLAEIFQNQSHLASITSSQELTFSGTSGEIITIRVRVISPLPILDSDAIGFGDDTITDISGDYGIIITDPLGGELFLKESFSQHRTLGNDNDFSPVENFQTTLTLISGSYSINTVMVNGELVGYDDEGAAFTLGARFRNPTIDSASIEVASEKTELIPGGFQVVNSSTSYIRIDRNLSGSKDDTFVKVRGFIASDGVLPLEDDLYDMGSAAKRWNDIWATNATIQTSDATDKFDIEVSDLGLDFINNQTPVKYKWIDTKNGRTHYGLIAQNVSSSLHSMGKPTKEFAGFISSSLYSSGGIDYEEESLPANVNLNNYTKFERQGLRYNEFIAPMINAIQELSIMVKTLEDKVDDLESIVSSSHP